VTILNSTDKKIRLFRSYLGRYPLWLAWQVTYRCNFRCGFCGYWHDEQGQMPEQTVEQFRRGAGQLGRVGSMFVSLAGGEPLLRDDLIEIIQAIARWHLPFVTTNGYLMTPELAKEMYRAGLWGVSVSLDYADAGKHDRRRGVKGAFDRAVAALDALAKGRKYRWQRVNLMAVLMHDNLDELAELAKIAAQFGAYFMVQPYCPLKTGDQQFICREPDMVERLLELRARHANFLSNPHFLSLFGKALNGGVPGCKAGRAFFNIDSLGNVSICVERRSDPVGNLYRDNVMTIMHRMREAAKVNRCQSCWYNCRGEVESLYHPVGLIKSLPTYFLDRGRAPTTASMNASAATSAN
jgi:MoaA/NifB/PqqE/SkfB family radical SAM enzyme